MDKQNKQQKYIDKVNRALSFLDFNQLTVPVTVVTEAMPDPLCGRSMRRLFLCIIRTIWTGVSMNLLSCPL